MIRTKAINYLIENRGYKSYLEIGLSWPKFNYTNVRCENKESCDPYFPSERDALVSRDNLPQEILDNLTYLMTSDEMFEAMPADKKYDIILIDALHTEEQCCKDIVNSMAHLNPGGVILVHDVIPLSEDMQDENSESVVWVGSVWKSIVKLNNTNISFHTINEDYGLAIIDYCPNPEFGNYLEPSGYNFNDDFSNEAVHVITDREFRDMYPPITLFKKGEPVNLFMYIDIDKNADVISQVQNLHLTCIEYFKNVFTNVTFVLGVDRDCSPHLVKQFRNKISAIGFNCDFAIKTEKKGTFAGSSFFHDAILNKLNDYEGITAFINCTDDGISNMDKTEKNSAFRTIASSYFQMFDNMEYVKYTLSKKTYGLCYGAFMFKSDTAPTRNKWQYYKGFQWLNTKRLYNYLSENGISLPSIDSKVYAERFLGNILPFDFTLEDSWSAMYLVSDISIMKTGSESATFCIFDENNSLALFESYLEDIFRSQCIPLRD